MTKLINTLNLALDLPFDLRNVIFDYLYIIEFKKIKEFSHSIIIKHGHINIDSANDTATLEKGRILHKTLLTSFSTYIYIHWLSQSINTNVLYDYKYHLHNGEHALFPQHVDVLKDICLTKEYECFLIITGDKHHLHLKSKTMLYKKNQRPIHFVLKSNFDHLFVIPNQTPETLVLIKEETEEIILVSMTDLKVTETSLKVVKKPIIHRLDSDTNIETYFYFSKSDNITTYLGSKTYFTNKTEKFNAIFVLTYSKRRLCVLRETCLELYEEYMSYD